MQTLPTFPTRSLAAMLLLTGCLAATQPADAAITVQQRVELQRVTDLVIKAGKSYAAGEYDDAGKTIQEAQSRLAKLVASGDMQLYQQATPLFTRIGRAHALLELEGVRLTPFRKPAAPKPMAKPEPAPAKPAPKPNTPTPAATGVSFTKEVAPILVKNCGRCHVTGEKGDFSMATYNALMRGPEIGIVVMPGKPAGSRLVEIIQDGSMPPNGRGIPAPELRKLTTWVAEGAKFDGTAPDTRLTAYSSGAGRPAGTPPPAIRQATGRETVSFAKDVASILIQNCNGCHIDAMRVQGGLNMDTFSRLMRGGDNGAIINAGSADTSMLIKKLKGQMGQRMPAGGRPALSNAQIQLISTWINEGATLDGSGPDQPLRVMTSLAWARDATHQELMERRVQMADDNWKLGSPEEQPTQLETENFYVVGSVGANTLKAVADQAELALEDAIGIVRRSAGGKDSVFKGRATIFVFPRRYDYSEFGKMIERRTLPQSWREHWRYDGIDAYAAMVVTPNDQDDQIRTRLVGPLASLLLATLGDVPTWMSEGIGRAAAAKVGGKNNPAVARWDEQLPTALQSFSKPEQLLKKQLPAQQLDLIAYGIGQFLLDRSYKPKFDKLVTRLAAGDQFNSAFRQTYGGDLKDLITAYGKWAAAKSGRRRR